MSKYFFVIEMSYLIYFFQMIKEQDWIIFYVIVIKIFDHFPDLHIYHANKSTKKS